MARTTFSGPVVSQAGFIRAGRRSQVTINSGRDLTFSEHAGRLMLLDFSNGTINLPARDDSELGATYSFLVVTNSSANFQIPAQRLIGSVIIGPQSGTAAATRLFAPDNNDRTLNLNAGTRGGRVGSFVQFTSTSAGYMVQGQLLNTGTAATPFA